MNFDFENMKVKTKNALNKAGTITGEALINIGEFVKDNPEASTLIAGALGVGLKEYGKMKRSSDRRREESLKDRRFYDHSTGHSYITKREPTNSERREIDRRRRMGESYGDILYSMRLL